MHPVCNVTVDCGSAVSLPFFSLCLLICKQEWSEVLLVLEFPVFGREEGSKVREGELKQRLSGVLGLGDSVRLSGQGLGMFAGNCNLHSRVCLCPCLHTKAVCKEFMENADYKKLCMDFRIFLHHK